MGQFIQVGGALLVLSGFVLAQAGRLDPHARAYLLVNLVGSGILAVDAAIGGDAGFLLLEGVWAIVSAWSLVQVLRGRAPGAAH